MDDTWKRGNLNKEGEANEGRGAAVAPEVNVLALIKGKERFIFVYDDQSQEQLLDAIRHQAANPDLSMSWFDVKMLKEKAQEQTGRINPTPIHR